jgi:peptide/nickel transport system permease protein
VTAVQQRSRPAWAILAARHPAIVAVTALQAVFVATVLIGPIVYEPSPVRPNIRATLQPPGPEFPLGTDELGRDVLARVLHGGRTSLAAGLAVVAIGLVLGTVVGFLAGYFGGRLDFVLMRFTDLFLGFPALILAIALAAALGAGLAQGVVAAGLVWWPGFARLVRGQVLAIKPLQYVEAARALGASHLRLMVRHVLPACLGEIAIKATLDVGLAVLFVASLGFLGLGAQAPTPEWGSMIAQARTYILDHWWVGFFPGVAIGVTVLLFNALGDAVQPLFRR